MSFAKGNNRKSESLKNLETFLEGQENGQNDRLLKLARQKFPDKDIAIKGRTLIMDIFGEIADRLDKEVEVVFNNSAIQGMVKEILQSYVDDYEKIINR